LLQPNAFPDGLIKPQKFVGGRALLRAASDPAEGANSAPLNLPAGFEGPLRDGEGKRKRDVKELGREKRRKERGRKVTEGMEGTDRVKRR